MANKSKVEFVCTECGYSTGRWMGNCPSCESWNTLKEYQKPASDGPAQHKARLDGEIKAAEPAGLDEVPSHEMHRHPTGLSELDRALGGGFIAGSFVLLGGDPGIGKSTIALQIVREKPDLPVLYSSGEESMAQIKQRAGRIGCESRELKLYAETDVHRIIEQARKLQPRLLVVDSIQTLFRSDSQSMPGTVTQIRECAALLMQLAKREKITVLAIGHVTKEGELSGPRVLEHMVDTVLQFEGDKNLQYRILRAVKNRFGPANEIGVFEMSGGGLQEVPNPSLRFRSPDEEAASGSAVVCAMEGTRPLLLEVQALVSPTHYGVPQRTASGFDQRRLALLLAVLEKRCGLNFADQDVFLNIAGGLKLTETACDLGVMCALVSSLNDQPVSADTVLLGEVGLGGEVRKVMSTGQRLQEIHKMGLHSVVKPADELNEHEGLNLVSVRYLQQAMQAAGVL